jgi:hypothetical protein
MKPSSAAAGIMLIIGGVWTISQVWWGSAVERLGI